MSYRLHILLSVPEGDVHPLAIILKALETNQDFECAELGLYNKGSVIFADFPNNPDLFYGAVTDVSRDYPAIVFKLEYSYSGGGCYRSIETKIQNGSVIEEVERNSSGYDSEWSERIFKQGEEEVVTFHYDEVVNGEYVPKSKTYRTADIQDSEEDLYTGSYNMVNEVFASDLEPLLKLFQTLYRKYEIADSDYRDDRYKFEIDKDRLCLFAKGFWLEDFEMYVDDLIKQYPGSSITWNAHF